MREGRISTPQVEGITTRFGTAVVGVRVVLHYLQRGHVDDVDARAVVHVVLERQELLEAPRRRRVGQDVEDVAAHFAVGACVDQPVNHVRFAYWLKRLARDPRRHVVDQTSRRWRRRRL